MISVINITNRIGGLDILKDNLDKQSYKDFELIMCDGLYEWRKDEVKGYFDSFPTLHIPEPKKNEKDVWVLNKAHNEALRKSKGDIIVFKQRQFIPERIYDKMNFGKVTSGLSKKETDEMLEAYGNKKIIDKKKKVMGNEVSKKKKLG